MKINRIYEVILGDMTLEATLSLSLNENSKDEWECEIKFSLPDQVILQKKIYGIDAFQALENATLVSASTIENFRKTKAKSLTWIGGDGSGFT